MSNHAKEVTIHFTTRQNLQTQVQML